MAWNGKRQLQSASESLLNNFEFVEGALVCVQYPVKNAASVIIEVAWLKEEKEEEERR